MFQVQMYKLQMVDDILAFFEGFENDNILSSKSYRVTKSEITPQLKLGSLQNLKLKLIR